MGIHHALYSGVTGLNSNSDGMAVIANNIANANTRSFKSDRAEFEDLLSVSLNEASQLGRGSRLRNIATNFGQGALTPTGGITDLGIQGDGFFIVKNDQMEVKESNAVFYTRQGSFHFNRDGFICDSTEGKLMGYTADQDGKLSSKLSPLQISSNSIPPVATTRVNIAVNLDTRERPPLEEFDVKRPSLTSNHSSTVSIFDNMGQIHQCTVYFSKVETGGDKNLWKWNATVDGREVVNGPGVNEKGEPIPAVIAKGEVEFDSEGRPVMQYRTKEGLPTFIDTLEHKDATDVHFANGAIPQKIQFNLGPSEDENGQMSTQMSSSQAAKSSTFYHSQNGAEAGYLKSLKIDLDGSVRGVYTNGMEKRLAAVAMASFQNNAGLQKVGRNSYIAPPRAGEPRIGLPQSGTRGSIYSSSLEESNVDLAQQFVDMITTQRGFQANSKSITTTDSLMDDIINLKR